MGEELVTETKKQEDQGSTTGNLIGGVVASIMSLPEAMAYGVLVFSAFHPQYAAQGLLAGIIAVVTANVGSALVRGVPIMSSSPFSLVTLILVY
jgi:MFS superfamily sulfate permease-like transporter